MPIRINLLAEAQAAEEIRRRDPVKRSAWAGGCLVALVLIWSSFLQAKIITDNSKLTNLEAKLGSKTNQYSQIISNKKRLKDVEDKLQSLNRLVTNRFLNGTVLDALQHSTIAGIQLTRMRTEQSFEIVPEVKPVLQDGKRLPGKPGGSTERIKLVLDAKDTSLNPGGDLINRYKETLAHTTYFQNEHISTNDILLKNLSAPQLDTESGKPYVLFNLECRYPERIR
ncbi:MAG: hypothetical protein JWR26_2993 [Pedosphaera sp.]|nr:hypothetical protein [Pedosphaera sp.]